MVRAAHVETVYAGQDAVGESPVWNAVEKALYWVDVRAPAVRRWTPDGAVTSWSMPDTIGPIAFTPTGELMGGMPGGYYRIGLSQERADRVVAIEGSTPGLRLNDGKCDRRGRFWGGTRGPDANEPVGSIYCIDHGGQCREIDSGFFLPNGLAFSPDDQTLIIADTAADAVYRYDFDLEEGRASNRRLFFSTQDDPWRVDGATFDADGFYWCALIRGGAVGRFDPNGKLDRIIELPVRHPTMCCFGGENLDTLYVTSGSFFLTPEERAANPLAGGLFAIQETGARGIPEPRFTVSPLQSTE